MNEVFDAEGIKKAIVEKVKATQEMKDIGYDIRLLPEFQEEKKETEDEKKKRIGIPANDIHALLREFECEAAIEKLKEH